MSRAAIEYLKQNYGAEELFLDEPLAGHTTFRIGGVATALVYVSSKEKLAEMIGYFDKLGQEYMLLGNGSNLLVSDRGYDGIVISLCGELARIEVEGDRIICGAGAMLTKVAMTAAASSLSGLAFAAGIPGTIGGGVIMNAGAYDGEMKQVVESVWVLDKTGREMVLTNDTMQFGYRQSVLKGKKYVVTQVALKLLPGNEEEIRAKMDDFNQRRRDKQPLNYPSAGSTFKRPEGNFAGKLIMDAGLRGYRVGDAQISEKHCGFVVNIGQATARDVYDVIMEARERVNQKFHVCLEPEVILVGDFS